MHPADNPMTTIYVYILFLFFCSDFKLSPPVFVVVVSLVVFVFEIFFCFFPPAESSAASVSGIPWTVHRRLSLDSLVKITIRDNAVHTHTRTTLTVYTLTVTCLPPPTHPFPRSTSIVYPRVRIRIGDVNLLSYIIGVSV